MVGSPSKIWGRLDLATLEHCLSQWIFFCELNWFKRFESLRRIKDARATLGVHDRAGARARAQLSSPFIFRRLSHSSSSQQRLWEDGWSGLVWSGPSRFGLWSDCVHQTTTDNPKSPGMGKNSGLPWNMTVRMMYCHYRFPWSSDYFNKVDFPPRVLYVFIFVYFHCLAFDWRLKSFNVRIGCTMMSSVGGRTSDVAVVVTHALRARRFKTAVVRGLQCLGHS